MFLSTLESIFLLLLFGSQEINSCEEHVCQAHQSEDWSYGGSNGPSRWPELFPTCGGTKQSPIDIITSQAEEDNGLVLERGNYNKPIRCAEMQNNGHTIQFASKDAIWRYIRVAAGSGRYTWKQCHFHWGSTVGCGSEHLIDGKSQSMEMHCVHEDNDGNIAVIGVLFQESDNKNTALDPVIKHLRCVRYRNQKTTIKSIKSPIDLNKLIPGGSPYYRYDGSLTTPECNEGVVWTLLKNPQDISTAQMAEFRKIFSTALNETEKCPMSDNFRPPQNNTNRAVKLFPGNGK